MDNKLNINPPERSDNFQQIKGVVKGCRVYYEHSISGGGGGGVGGYVNIKPIDHDATKHNEFWIVDSAGKEHFFDIEVPVTDGQLMSVFVSNHPLKQIFAAYNHSSEYYTEFVERWDEKAATPAKTSYIFPLLLFIFSALSIWYAQTHQGFFTFICYINFVTSGFVGLVFWPWRKSENANTSKMFEFVDTCMAGEASQTA